jgi:hypothetical protein
MAGTEKTRVKIYPSRNTNKGGYTFLKKLFTIVKAKIYTPCLERSFISNIYIFFL